MDAAHHLRPHRQPRIHPRPGRLSDDLGHDPHCALSPARQGEREVLPRHVARSEEKCRSSWPLTRLHRAQTASSSPPAGSSGTATRRLKRLTHLPRIRPAWTSTAQRLRAGDRSMRGPSEPPPRSGPIGPLLDGLVDSTALLGAFVRSLEKVQGALEAERQDFARRRLQDAQEFAARLPPSLTRVARDARTFAAHLEASEAMPRTEADRLGGRWAPGVKTLDAYFGDRPLATLYRVGVPISAIRLPPREWRPYTLSPGDPFARATDALRKASRAVDGLAESIAQWEPSVDA